MQAWRAACLWECHRGTVSEPLLLLLVLLLPPLQFTGTVPDYNQQPLPYLNWLLFSQNNLTGDLSGVSALQVPADAEVYVAPMNSGPGICGEVSWAGAGHCLGCSWPFAQLARGYHSCGLPS